MTEADLNLLKSQIDQVVVLETVDGERLLVQPLFVFDEGETPDVFCREMEHDPASAGRYKEKGSPGLSILLADILTAKLPAG